MNQRQSKFSFTEQSPAVGNESFSPLSDIFIGYHMVKNMEPRQLQGILERKMRHLLIPHFSKFVDHVYERQIPDDLVQTTWRIEENITKLRKSVSEAYRTDCQRRIQEVHSGQFTFIGKTIDCSDHSMWSFDHVSELPLLWYLKLQAFTHFEWLIFGYTGSTLPYSLKVLCDDHIFTWQDETHIAEPNYLRRSWIPHAVSLRILNWCRYAALCNWNGYQVPYTLIHNIYKNALFLENHVEYDIDGNHLIENAVALVMAGTFFKAHQTGWIAQGVDLLENVCRSQFLTDGCHYERSPMYHIMVLRRLLTVIDLLKGTTYASKILHDTAKAAIGFLVNISKPNGKIPLLNDAVFAEELPAHACINYGTEVGIEGGKRREYSNCDSGYRLLSNPPFTLLFDVGEVGPPHLPAHSHNDHLNVLFWVNDTPVVTDTGVFNYDNNARRKYARSIRAHNTVQVDNFEPIPIKGKYLMGRRTNVDELKRTPTTIKAKYSREGLFSTKYTHNRSVQMSENGFEITDRVTDCTDSELCMRYHFAPKVSISEITDQNSMYTIEVPNEPDVTLSFNDQLQTRIINTPYYKRFGTEIKRSALEIQSYPNTNIRTEVRIE